MQFKGVGLRTNYIFIDLENVQPKNLEVLKGYDFKVTVFVGSTQNKITFDMADAMQSLGSNAQYVKIEGSGPNALDFHIAFYVGQISAQESDAYFHIISKDTGFDPLIKHLNKRKVHVQRHKDIIEIPLLQIANSTSMSERLELIIKFLKSRGTGKPRKRKTLSNAINSLFMRKLEEQERTKLIEELVKQKVVIEKDNSISYNL